MRLAEGVPLKSMTRHILGLFNGQPGARAWRRCLSEQAHRSNSPREVIEQALAAITEASTRRAA
jgi:tRNA-dihydrouridine synthase A